MAVIGIAWQGTHDDHEVLVDGGGDTDLCAKLIADLRLALLDEVHLGLVKGIDLALAVQALMQQPANQPKLVQNPRAEGALRDILQSKKNVLF